MRKLYLFNFVTLDGFFEGAGKWELDWHNVDEEFQEFAADQLNETDILLFGRITYEGMAGYWTTPAAMKNDPVVAGLMNSLPKIVLSRTLEEVSWNNTRLIKENVAEEVSKLKSEPGKDIGILGNADLASTVIRQSLVDEYRIIVNPVVLGNGRSLFEGIDNRMTLRLLRSRSFKSGKMYYFAIRPENRVRIPGRHEGR